MADIHGLRRDYNLGELRQEDLDSNPITQFNHWLKLVIDSGTPDPTAMTVATVSADGQPSQRIVLLKDVDDRGFVFYTNLGSRKATELANNSKISLHFPWYFMERQVKICGVAQPLSTAEVAKYFFSRPKESQLAAWASKQSQPISTRQMLMSKFDEVKKKFSAGEIPVPKFWGGYRVVPHEIEFWQGGEHRLHNRFVYTLDNSNSTSETDSRDWQIQRLMP
ncbi:MULTISPECIES: pyridoxamine 5'-phosphate oxidase [Alteromonadaceae]|uniref:pyridoxamine 5'-phosphate oxidase n=1 Tax=Alteromonadaceae TaxID=72275 RepID=UPI001C089CD5|nr:MULTISPECIES: pyridoxamine 5'-phosphate oxidase [Aliiglaciecola]MBU2877863.1 pyridoxamine 5'-phosphate oxidase [Aliiglaciecola lipolytica]MDO6709226.1 pyridoxamine 5'-phosphate oxidase [Aliiglaciecola sp. 2_MG-2023]MDO6750374.1 pyridoxamine 5'-phosphate oxidase [Aliiglaciecola sp. 1_MG-2023]